MAEHDLHTIGTATFEEVSMIPRNILLRNQAVALGDIRYTSKLKSNLFLECTQAGTTGSTMPSFVSVQEGDTVTDGTAIWKVVRSITSSDTIDSGVKVADVSSVGYEMATGQVSVTWTDPDDVVYQGASLARWAGTKLVRKTGSAPANETDGTLVVDSTVKNAYSTTAYVDSGLVDGTTYYYRLFPYTDVGSVTAGTSFSAAPNKHLTTMTVTKDCDAYAVAVGTVEVATITTDGDGLLVATSSDETVGIASVSNGKVVVELVSEGTITVTVRQLAGLEWSSAGPVTISIDCRFASTTLGDNSPDVIAAMVKSGQAANLWNVGDKVGIKITGTFGQLTFNNETIYASILGFDHNKEVESGGKHNVHFIFGKTANNVDICFCDSGYGSGQSGANYFHHHTSNTNTNGWSGSDLRTMCSTFLGCMPAEWQAVIGSSTKYSDNHGGGSDTASYVTATQDKVFLLAEWEVQGARTYANSAEKTYQQQYDYYKNGNSKIRYKHNSTSSAARWWLRSVYASPTTNFCGVNTDGSAYHISASSSIGFAPGFAIF